MESRLEMLSNKQNNGQTTSQSVGGREGMEKANNETKSSMEQKIGRDIKGRHRLRKQTIPMLEGLKILFSSRYFFSSPVTYTDTH